MKNLLTIIFLFLFVLTTTLLVRADIARPKQVPNPTPENKTLYSYLQVIPDSKASGARLQIKQSVFNQLAAGTQGSSSNAALTSTAIPNNTRTIIAGVLLFLSIAFAGVWIARTMRTKSALGQGQKTVAALMFVIVTVGAAAVITHGNAPPPGYQWRGLATALAEGRTTFGEVTIEIVPDASLDTPGARLIVPVRKQNPKNGEE
jgi:hypothetical protein